MSKKIETITASSDTGGDVYRLLNLVHVMAGNAANSERKDWWLARTQSDPQFGPIVTVWTNGIVDIEARTWDCGFGVKSHEYTLSAIKSQESEE